jgi:aminoglycoside phosphotransferase (APT) family kinase protein
MSNHTTMLMRSICEELSARIIPELSSADARERATLSRMILQNLAADIDVLADLAVDFAPRIRSAIAAALQVLAAEGQSQAAEAWRGELAAIAVETDIACQREIASLRDLASRIVRDAADRSATSSNTSAVQALIANLGTLDHQWLTRIDAARNTINGNVAAAGTTSTAAAPAAGPEVNVETATRYLKKRFPHSPDIRATEVIPIPGGRSKKTFFLSIDGSDVLPEKLVMRQDYALRYEGTKVRDEYQPLLKLSELKLPVPKPLLLEAEESELGPPFIFVQRLQGSPPGSYFGMQGSCPGAFAELAQTLATLHRANPADLGLSVAADPEKGMLRLIDAYQKKWRDNATKPSPMIDYAFAWARRECEKEDSLMAVVHGDSGPYNFLVHDDHLIALLDWEFVHTGDPAEDLGIARCYAEQDIPWEEFMRLYVHAGGRPVSERRVQLGMLVQFLKGTTLCAASGRNFEEGWTREFIKGASAYTGLRLIEMRIATLLQRFGAV